MSARRIVVGGLLAVVAIVVAVVVLGSEAQRYKVRFQLTSANGLRKGSPVKMGGADVGNITSLKLGPGDYPVAEADLDPTKARVGKGATAKIVATNLLGSKVLELSPGRGKLPSGTLIPRSRISTPVDLDQVLDVLDPDTRTRLQILVNEAGIAMTGRRVDFNQALNLLPQDLSAGSRLLDQLVADNHSLRETVAASSRFVTRITEQRRQLSRLVSDAGQTMEAVAEKRGALRETLARAPRTLVSLQRFLGDLRITTVPLGPAARALKATAPELTQTLAALPPFQRAADPVLRHAVAVAPSLTRLGHQATPVLRRANPTLLSLAKFVRTLPPVSHTVDVSIDDALGLIEGWARAIQNRDGVGHIFHGKATISPEVIRALVNLSLPTSSSQATHARATRTPKDQAGASRSPASSPGSATGDGSQPSLLLDYLLKP